MHKNRRRLRRHAKLPKGLEKRLKTYALVASAAGVGLLALAPVAKADIFKVSNGFSWNSVTGPYSSTTSTGGLVEQIGLAPGVGFVGGESLSMMAECFYDFCTEHGFWNAGADLAVFATGLGWVGMSKNGGFLPAGAPVFGSGTMRHMLPLGMGVGATAGGFANNVMAYVPGSLENCVGPVANCHVSVKQSGYIGLNGYNPRWTQAPWQFGWAKVTASVSGGISGFGVLEGFPVVKINIGPIYEGTCGSDQPMLTGQTSCEQTPPPPPTSTPEPGTLALLAMGAVGLFALRRKKLAVDN